MQCSKADCLAVRIASLEGKIAAATLILPHTIIGVGGASNTKHGTHYIHHRSGMARNPRPSWILKPQGPNCSPFPG